MLGEKRIAFLKLKVNFQGFSKIQTIFLFLQKSKDLDYANTSQLLPSIWDIREALE